MRSAGHLVSLLLPTCAVLLVGEVRADAAPVVEAAPNMYGQTGVVRTTSARPGGHLVFDFGAFGFGGVAPDFLDPDPADLNTLSGGTLAASGAFFDLVEVSLAMRAASNANTARGPSQFSVGDFYPSLKLAVEFLPVALGVDVRGHLPTRQDRAGWDLQNWAVATQGLVTLDLHDGMDIPLRAHLNGGYTFQGGKYAHGDGRFEDNPNFYNGVDGALLALAADAWFYDSATAGLGVEVPLPYATPFVEAWYRTAVGVPADRGAGGKGYDVVGDAHLTVTPGVRVAVGPAMTLDVGADVGVLGGAGGGTDATKVVQGTPINPLWLARVGLSGTFDPFHSASSPRAVESTPADVEPTASVSTGDTEGSTTKPTAVPAAPSGTGRLIGWITNKDDEAMDAEVEIWDASGSATPVQTRDGGFDLSVKSGPIAVVAKAAGHLAAGTTVVVEPGGRARAELTLKKIPKARKASLERDRIATTSKIPFAFKKPRLQSTAEYVLDDVVDLLLRNPTIRIRIEVRSEALASTEESQRLADERAAAVADYLVAHGVWRGRIETKGSPLAPGEGEKLRGVDLLVVP